MSIGAASLGFVFLTFSIAAGSVGWGRLLDHPAWQDPKVVAEVSRGIGDAMPGLEMSQVPEEEKLQTRGW